MNNKRNIVKEKSFLFAVNSVMVYKEMIESNEFLLSKQFIRSATSIGVNVEEANARFSKRDFTAKMSIASKEAREANYWIRLFEKSNLYKIDLSDLNCQSEELIRLTTSIVKSSQKNKN